MKKFDEIVQELKTGGAKFEEIDAVVHLLVTLLQEYDSVVAALAATNASSGRQLNVETVKEYLLDYETNKKQKEMATGSETMKYFHIFKKNQRKGKSEPNWKNKQESNHNLNFKFKCNHCNRTLYEKKLLFLKENGSS